MNHAASCASDLATSDSSRSSTHTKNVGDLERAVSLGAGAALIAGGIKTRGLAGLILAGIGGALAWRGYKGRCAAYSALGIDTAHTHRPAEPEDFYERGVLLYATVTINADADPLYRFWRTLENLPRFMTHLDEVRIIDDTRSHWVARGPAGKRVEWDAEIINDEPGSTIAWRTIENAEVEHTGSVRFVPAGAGRTQVKVRLEYLPPVGRITNTFLSFFGQDPRSQIKSDLRRFKHLFETGAVPVSGRGAMPRPARSRAADLSDHAGAAPDPVYEASNDSFPASDAPGWTSAQI